MLPGLKKPKKGSTDTYSAIIEEFSKALYVIDEDDIYGTLHGYMEICREQLGINQTELRKKKLAGELS
jgi:hypothetical protein